MHLLHALFALAMNAVPIVGVYEYGWSVPTILVLFWVENVAITIAHCVRIVLHRRISRRAGHWNHSMTVNGAVQRTTLLNGYGMMAGFFTFGHGIFVLLFAFLVIPQQSGDDPAAQFDMAQFVLGAQVLLLITAFDVLLDLHGMRQRSYAWIDRETARRMLRVIVLHLGIIFGAMAIAGSSAPVRMLYVLLGIKALVDFLAALGGGSSGSAQLSSDDRFGDPERVV